MVCNPNDNSLTPPNLGPPPNLGFGPIYAPPQIPFPDLSLPEGIPEDIVELLESLFIRIPGGRISATPDLSLDSVFDVVSSLLTKLAPYLAFYSFIQSLLNMIICIIEVLCALINPFKTIRAVRRLFKQCIPDFLSMFPFIALIAMILAFILLLIALIEYLINIIIQFINDIIANLNDLAEAFQIGDEQGIIAITAKISQLLCLIEQIFSILIVFQILFVIIRALAELGGFKPCKRGSVCCDDETCPEFIGDNPDGTFGTGGRLIYHNRINLNVNSVNIPGFSDTIAPLREERWQFVDDDSPDYPFKSIITPPPGSDTIFWPQPQTYQKGDSLNSTVPYVVDMRMLLDPTVFGHTSLNGSFDGERYFRVKDVIIDRQPYIGIISYNNTINVSEPFGNSDGTVRLVGGLVFEDDGVTPFNVDGQQATIDTFISRDPVTSTQLPASEDGYFIEDIEWNMKINHEVLMKYQIITAGCIPDIQTETEVMDTTIPDVSSVLEKIGELPDLDEALECLSSSINAFRQDASIEQAAVFQNSVVGCLEDLRDQSIEVFTKAVQAGVSPYKSEVTLDPDVQFFDLPIQVSVNLKDAGGTEIGENMPQKSATEIAELLDGNVTFGNISNFEYDGYALFVADITATAPGSGELQVSFDGNFLSEVLNTEDVDTPSEISIITLPYEFVGTDGGGTKPDAVSRRDETDAANTD